MKKIITDSFSGGLITSCSEIKILGWSGPLKTMKSHRGWRGNCHLEYTKDFLPKLGRSWLGNVLLLSKVHSDSLILFQTINVHKQKQHQFDAKVRCTISLRKLKNTYKGNLMLGSMYDFSMHKKYTFHPPPPFRKMCLCTYSNAHEWHSSFEIELY